MDKWGTILFFSLSLFAASESIQYELYPFRGTPLPDSYGVTDSWTDYALYNDKGVWDTGFEHLKMFLTEYGHSYRVVSSIDILNGELKKTIGGLIMPGGESWEYLKSLGEQGATAIRKFVYDGGGYIGICAGAFYAVSDREGGKHTGPYGIGLLKGVAFDGTALKVPPFIEGMMDFDVTAIPFMQGFQKLYRIVLFGGPSFRVSDEEVKLKLLRVPLLFQKINEPAMVQFQYGEGNVYLSGPHLEIEEDRTDWGKEYKDPESDWPLFEKFANWTRRR